MTWTCQKKQARLLGSRLKGWNLLSEDTKVCFFRNIQKYFENFYSQEGDLVFFNAISYIMNTLGHKHKLEEWCLFIDLSKVSLKA